MKGLLRSTADLGILEGFLTELLKENITILDIQDSERYQGCRTHNFNCIDLKVRNSKQEIIIIEIQYDREYDYLQRIFYGVSKKTPWMNGFNSYKMKKSRRISPQKA